MIVFIITLLIVLLVFMLPSILNSIDNSNVAKKEKIQNAIKRKNYDVIVAMYKDGYNVDNYVYLFASANINARDIETHPICYMNSIQKIKKYHSNEILEKFSCYPKFQILYNEGVCCFYLGKFSEAIKCFDEALALKKDPRIFYNRALCKLELKDNKNALHDLKLAFRYGIDTSAISDLQKVKKIVDKIYGDI